MLLVRRNKAIIKMNITKYTNEEKLMEIFSDSIQTLIPLEIIGEDNESILAYRMEFPVDSGSIDLLAISNIGSIYIVETKLFRNKTRREVVAQALDYAAALWKNFADDVDGFIDVLLEKNTNYESNSLRESLNQVGLERTLREAYFKIIVVMDSIDEQTKILIEFLNKHTDFKILGLEILYYCKDDLEVLQPNVFGEEITKEIKTKSNKRRWEYHSLRKDFEMIETINERERMLDLLDWAEKMNVFASVTSSTPQFSLKLKKGKIIYFLRDGQIAANIGNKIDYFPSEESRIKMFEGLKELGFFENNLDINQIPVEKTIRKRIHQLNEEEYLKFIKILNEIIDEDS